MESKYFIVFFCLAFVAFLIFQEIRRNDKSRLTWRIIASMVMVASFALLIFPISYTIKKEEPIHELNLLTEGASLDTVLALKTTVYTKDSSLFFARKKLKINYMADLAYHLKVNPAIKKINVYGYGLDDQDLKALKDYQVSFHPALIPSGVLSASWQKNLAITEALTIQGSYHNATKDELKLKLYGMGEDLDSLTVKPETRLDFSLSTEPKQIGRAVFNLVALRDKDTISVDPVPFEVTGKQPISVLMLASFPDFEYKFLKQWLYENQYLVAFRTQISKDKYSTDFLNRKPTNINRLTQALFKDIDLVVIDEAELSAISKADKTSIYNAVNNGMGLIVRSSKANTYEAISPNANALSLKADLLKFTNLPFPQTLFLKVAANEQPLITDAVGKTVVGRKLSGMGKILRTTLASTYQWQLAGNKHDYARFWSLIFEKTLRKEIAAQSFEIVPRWPSVGEKSTVKVSLSAYKVPSITIDSISVSPRQNMELPFLWDGYFWPVKSGWSALSINQKTTSIYFYNKTDWKAAKSFDKLNNTTNFEANQNQQVLKANKIAYLSTEEISKWWFLAIFMISISFLWYEQRFLASK
ncbi:MAG TPA: hypothetical protein VL088_06935 [Pedobacter sp.]|nr:hypothetical protein [Pedobacter sp.]